MGIKEILIEKTQINILLFLLASVSMLMCFGLFYLSEGILKLNLRQSFKER